MTMGAVWRDVSSELSSEGESEGAGLRVTGGVA